MEKYRSRSGKISGVTAYDIGEDYIIVEFRSGERYKYSISKCGEMHIANMISRALNQLGLSTYISQNRDYLPFD